MKVRLSTVIYLLIITILVAALGTVTYLGFIKEDNKNTIENNKIIEETEEKTNSTKITYTNNDIKGCYTGTETFNNEETWNYCLVLYEDGIFQCSGWADGYDYCIDRYGIYTIEDNILKLNYLFRCGTDTSASVDVEHGECSIGNNNTIHFVYNFEDEYGQERVHYLDLQRETDSEYRWQPDRFYLILNEYKIYNSVFGR